MKTLNAFDAPQVITTFETEHLQQLASFTILSEYSGWQILKWPIVLELISQSSPADAKSSVDVGSKLARIKRIGVNIISGIKNRKRLTSKANQKRNIWIVTNSVDRLARNKDGLFFNSLMDPVIKSLKADYPGKVVHLENRNPALSPVFSQSDIDSNGFEYLLKFKQAVNSEEIKSQAGTITLALNEFLKKNGYTNAIEPDLIVLKIQAFEKELKFWEKMLAICKPSVIISSERCNTGFMAAARRNKITVHEFQHGAMDKDYPPYIINKTILSGKTNLKADKLFVFGNHSKKLVTDGGLYSIDDVVKVGYYKIDEQRKKLRKDEGLRKRVLICFQPFNLANNEELLKALVKGELVSGDTEIILKWHPLQQRTEIDSYVQIISGKTGIVIADKYKSIFELIDIADLVISFTSTVLQEAVSLERCAVTLTSKELPLGILTMIGEEKLQTVIRPADIYNINEIVHSFYTNEQFRGTWIAEIKQYRNYFYEDDYEANINNLRLC